MGAFLDEVRGQASPQRNTCLMCSTLKQWEEEAPEDGADLRSALADPGVQSAAIARAMSARLGQPIDQNRVSRCRRIHWGHGA